MFGSSWALPRGSWDVFWGSVVPVEPKRMILRTSSWASWRQVCCRKGNGRQSRKKSNMFARRPKQTVLGTSSWGSWLACSLSKGQRATEQKTGEHACQETETDDSGDLLLGLVATISPVEKRSAPGGPQREVTRVHYAKCSSVGAQTRALYNNKPVLRPVDRGLSADIWDFGLKQIVQ